VVAPVVNAGGVAGGRTVAGDSATLIVRLDDLVEANPGAMDNFVSFDTFFTPAPGKTLVVPKGKFQIMNRKDGVYDQTFEEAAEKLGVTNPITDLPLHHESRTSFSTAAAHMQRIAIGKFGATSTFHDAAMSHAYEKMRPLEGVGVSFNQNNSILQGNSSMPIHETVGPLSPLHVAQVSPNSAISHYDTTGVYSGFRKGTSRRKISPEEAKRLGAHVDDTSASTVRY
jgi:hypothetical protein